MKQVHLKLNNLSNQQDTIYIVFKLQTTDWMSGFTNVLFEMLKSTWRTFYCYRFKLFIFFFPSLSLNWLFSAVSGVMKTGWNLWSMNTKKDIKLFMCSFHESWQQQRQKKNCKFFFFWASRDCHQETSSPNQFLLHFAFNRLVSHFQLDLIEFFCLAIDHLVHNLWDSRFNTSFSFHRW